MPAKKVNESSPKKSRPIRSPEAREQMMIALALDQAEKELRAGTASPNIVTHFLKLATEREKKEVAILESKQKMMEAKTDLIESTKNTQEEYANAIKAMKLYSGEDDE